MKLSAQSVPIRLAATHILHDWTTSGPNSTWYAYQALGGSYSDETWNMFLGDGYPNGTSNYFYSNNDQANNHRVMEFANNNRVGHQTRSVITTETTPVILVTASG